VSIPPPYTHVYSAGGPTGEVHVIDTTSGGFGEKVQQILFVKEEDLEGADKSPVALVSNKYIYIFSRLRSIPVIAIRFSCR
jgi:carboxy-cis,cis-muconate cyclase